MCLPFLVAGKALAAPVSCGDLVKLKLPHAVITRATLVAAGGYKLATEDMRLGGRPGMNLAGRIELAPNPAFCSVAATLKPTSDSNIEIEIWLPESSWSGKFLAAGNFGWGGALMHVGMLTGVTEGYATASTNTGHDSSHQDENGGHFALGHPHKLIDYAYRADHEMTLDAKAIIKAFYGTAPSRSYWIGCSLGGLEGLIEAKRYPLDFDGIVAGAPPNPIARFNALQIWPNWLVSQDPSRLIPQSKYAMIHDAALKACASPTGLKDKLIDAPDRCDFQPDQLQCKDGDAPDCLTAPQVYLLQQTYRGPSNPRTKEIIFPGPARGSELDMYGFANGEAPTVALDLFRYAAFQKSDWNYRTMDWDADVNRAIQIIGPLMHVDSDLKPFFDHGGKLLMYIGWADYHNPEELISYYRSVIRSSGGEQLRSSIRLFTIPGMNHCAGGAGCDTFNKLGVIDDWVARGTAPDRILAAKVSDGNIVRTRPLCAYPTEARYRGSGDTDDAANFVCISN
jgi:feruloyl esterase